ncbi:MAG: hypothetical protein ACTSSE_08490 [Candidatus Thorarchaeota archaeon]
MKETERMFKIEEKKNSNLIDSAQKELDSAKKAKAPKSTIKHMEQRVKALEGRKDKIEKAITKTRKEEITGDENATASSGKKAGKTTKGDE